MSRIVVSIVAALVLLTSGLLGPASAHGAAAMSIQVLSPADPVSVPMNGKIPIHIKVTGIKLDMAAMGRKPVAGEGHYHIYVDCIPPVAYLRNNNLGACWATAVATTSTTFDLATSHVPVRPGPHTLFLALAQNNHVLYRVAPAAIQINVTVPQMSIQVVSPTQPVTVAKNGKIPIHIKVTGIKLDMAAMGRKPVAGEGHYHIYVDCIPPVAYLRNNNLGACWATAAATTSTTFDLATSHAPVNPGTHVLLLALAQNNHVLYRAPVADIVVTVTK